VILAGEKPSAMVVTKIIRTLESTAEKAEYAIEKSFKLFHVSQTKPARKTPLHAARLDFYENYVRQSNRNKLIRWTKGQWVKDADGERYWDGSADVWDWRTYQEHLGLDACLDHLKGQEIYGVFGAKTCSYLLIDLDLHKTSLILFLRRLGVLLDAFHGKHRCHFQVSDEKAGGVHVILQFGKQGLIETRRRWITNLLVELDREHPGLSLTKLKRGKPRLNVEVYPTPSKGHRLPLCRGRTTLLDKPLPLVKRGQRQVQDVIGYMNWLNGRDRQYMKKDEVYRFVVERLQVDDTAPGNNRTNSSNTPHSTYGPIYMSPIFSGETEPAPEKATKTLKGKVRGAIVGFWQRGEPDHFRSLNTAIAVTLRAMYFEGLRQDTSVALVSRYVDELPNKDLSSRLADGRQDIDRVIQNDAVLIWDGNGGQEDSQLSAGKWRNAIKRWREIGFLASDKSTWAIAPKPKLTIEISALEDFDFTDDERRLLIEQVAPVLVGEKQARKENRQQEVVRAVKFFLQYIKWYAGEIPVSALPVILKTFDLKLRNHDKQKVFFDLLKEWEWIYVRADYSHPAKHGGIGGRARAYGIGKAMAGKFRGYVPDTPHRTYGPIYMSPIFPETVLTATDLPSFDTELSESLGQELPLAAGDGG
jgi:hypothetical protein